VMGGPTFEPALSYGCCTNDMDTGFNVGGAVGTDLSDWLGRNWSNWAAQGDVLYTDSGYDCCGTNLETLTLMGDVVYNFRNRSRFTPYMGVGIGAVDDMVSDPVHGTSTGWAFAYQAFVGVDYRAWRNVSLFGEYRYQSSVDATVSGDVGKVSNVGYESHNLIFGARLHF